MRWNTSLKFRAIRGAAAALVMATVLGLGSGCAQLNDPWKDSSAAIDSDMTTTTTKGYEGKPEFGRPIRRDTEPSQVAYQNTQVTHWPLWFEDPFEDKGNGYEPVADRDAPDDVFAMNWVDYLHIAYGPGRLLVNIAGFPASVIVTPPGTLMESDGRISKNILGYDHDARRSDSAMREPPDVNNIDRSPFTLEGQTTTNEPVDQVPVDGESSDEAPHEQAPAK